MIEMCNHKTVAARARRMSIAELLFAISDATAALACAKQFEEAGMGGNTGKYMDQLSIYRGELAKKQKAITKRKYGNNRFV